MSPIKNKPYPRHVFTLLLPFALILGIALLWMSSNRKLDSETFVVKPVVFEKWTPLLGRLEAANPLTLRAELDGLSKITWLIEDGTPVAAGEDLVHFDPSELEERKLTLARDLDIADAELRSLAQAQHPLEMQRLESDLLGLQNEMSEEQSLRNDTAELVNENLLPESELERHDLKIKALQANIQSLQTQITLTREILHPALEQRASARLNAAKTALARVETRLQNTRMTSPVDGTVYLPRLHIDGEQRQLRVGDGLYRNQVILEVADLTRLIIKTSIPEQALSGVVPGLSARIRFPAFPDKVFSATLSRVGAHPEGDQQRYPVTLELREDPGALRPGLSAEIEVLEYRREDALLVPREWIRFANGQPELHIRGRGFQAVEIGDGNPGFVCITEGLHPGEVLLAP